MKKLFSTTRMILLSLLGAGALLGACSNGSEDFTNWIIENQGKPMSPELMEDLISEFGTPLDTLRGEDVEIEFYSSYLFLGPHLGIEEGKALFEQERMENAKLFADYTALCAESTSELNSNCLYYEEFKNLLIQKNEKYAALYDSISKKQKTTMGTFLAGYKAKFPGLTEEQYLDSLRAFELPGISDYQIDQFKETRYSFISQASVSYASVFGGSSSSDDDRDFKVDVYNDIVVLENGTISSETPNGSAYCITDDSKEELENHLVGTWEFESGGTSASYTINEDGTFSFTSSLFDIYKEGQWWINCSGELENSYGDNLEITNSGILAGETLYTK